MPTDSREPQHSAVTEAARITAEATVKATFEFQNASLAAGVALLEAATTSQRTVIKQWDTAAHSAQQAALEAFRAQVRATSRLFEQAPAGR